MEELLLEVCFQSTGAAAVIACLFVQQGIAVTPGVFFASFARLS
jgi:hypothetical protein